jgi:mannose-6-phosphate isomerase-like protein (cupin superfamily)
MKPAAGRWWAVALALLWGCTSTRIPTVWLPDGRVDVAALTVRDPLAAGQAVRAERLSATERVSVHFVQLAPGAGERSHLHATHDLTVIVLQGSGTQWIRAESLSLQPGDSAVVPAGTPHRFVNTGDGVAAALVVFSPPHDGSDQVFLDAP